MVPPPLFGTDWRPCQKVISAQKQHCREYFVCGRFLPDAVCYRKFAGKSGWEPIHVYAQMIQGNSNETGNIYGTFSLSLLELRSIRSGRRRRSSSITASLFSKPRTSENVVDVLQQNNVELNSVYIPDAFSESSLLFLLESKSSFLVSRSSFWLIFVSVLFYLYLYIYCKYNIIHIPNNIYYSYS